MTERQLRRIVLEELEIMLEEDSAEDTLKSILKDEYVTFVNKLGTNIKDKKFLDAVKSLTSKGAVKTTDMNVPVQDLRPTQNEVVLDKSLNYALKDAKQLETFLKGGTIAVAGKSIVTAGGGKWVIDGHHRWSQLYCFNPEASIKTLDLSELKEPMEALKATQLGIAAEIGDVPMAKGGGINLFKIDKGTLGKYIEDTMTDACLDVFEKYEKGSNAAEVTDYIWGNVQLLQKKSPPAPGASSRESMPQTDDAPNFTKTTVDIENLAEEVRKLKRMIRAMNR